MKKNLLFNLRDCLPPALSTDKEDSYLENYDYFLSKWQNKRIKFLEIGIFNGGSLLMWADYFKKAQIHGIDMKSSLPAEFYQYLKEKKLSSRIKTFLNKEIPCLQMSKQKRAVFFQEFLKSKQYDVILDDGAHTYTHTMSAYEILFNDYLKPGGYYILEDWGTTYFPDWVDGSIKGEKGMARMIKFLYDEVALIDRLKGQKVSELEKYRSQIKSVTILFGQIWIEKNA